MSWEQTARFMEEEYGVYVSYTPGDRYFICPECDEPILEEDWDESDLVYCPICEFDWCGLDED